MTPDNWRYLILQPNQTIGHSKLLMLITGSLPNQSYTHGCVCITVHVSLYNIVVHQCKLPVTKLFLNNFHLKYTEKTYLGSSSFFSRERVHIPPKREKGNYPLKSAFLRGICYFPGGYTPEIQHSPWKMMVGRLLSFRDCLFLGAMQ